jgi:hypothetical protein
VAGDGVDVAGVVAAVLGSGRPGVLSRVLVVVWLLLSCGDGALEPGRKGKCSPSQ